METKEKKTINLSELILLFNRYAPLIFWLEESGHGFGEIEVSMHGKRPQKVRKKNRWIILDQINLEVLVDRNTVSEMMAPPAELET